MSFKIQYDDEYLEVHGGLSAEIIFGRSISHKRNIIYRGWVNKSPSGSPNFIKDSVEYIVSELKKLVNVTAKYAIIGSGLDCVSYMCDLMDYIYLPIQFLVEAHNIDGLKLMLENADKSGIKCYASIINSKIYPTSVVAYIKLLEIPKIYIDYLEQVRINRVLCIGIYNRLGLNTCKIRQYTDSDSPRQFIQSKNIYLYYPNENYGGRHIDDTVYSDKIENINMSHIKDTASYMCDWEYGVDNIGEFLIPFNGKGYVIYSDNITKMNILAYHITYQFMHNNDITPCGFVLNTSLIGNPFYEAIHGYYTYIYKSSNPNRIIDFLNVAESQLLEFSANSCQPEYWFNFHIIDEMFLQQLPVNQKVIMSNELATHITKYKGPKITDYKRVDICQFTELCLILRFSCFVM